LKEESPRGAWGIEGRGREESPAWTIGFYCWGSLAGEAARTGEKLKDARRKEEVGPRIITLKPVYRRRSV